MLAHLMRVLARRPWERGHMADPAQHQDARVTADPSGMAEFRIFLSYRREDASGHAGRLFDFLCQGGVGGQGPGFRKDQIFMDIDTIAPGVDFRRVIEEAVGSCDVFIAVIGKEWLSAVDAHRKRRLNNAQDFVRLEIEAALGRDIPVVPALVQGAEMPSVEELPETFRALAGRNAVELSDLRWSHDVGKLIAWLKAEEEKKTRRAQLEREQADSAELEQTYEEEWAAAEQVERDERARLERERAEQEREHGDEQREPERRRLGPKHVLLGAALLALAIAGIAGAMLLISGGGENDPTEAQPPTQPAPENDGDADGDGLADAVDPFALDAENGKELPVTLTFADIEPGTIEESGFTGLMTDGTTPFDELFDPDKVVVGDGTFELNPVGRGAAFEERNDQQNGFQFGVRVPDESFTAHVSLIEPFADGAPIGEEVMGLFVGPGDQDNFVRLGVGGGGEGLKYRVEEMGVTTFTDNRELVLPGLETVDLYLTIDPAAETIQAEVQATQDGETTIVDTLPRRSIPASWISGAEPLAVGIIASRGGSPQFRAVWGPIEVFEGNPP